jgi:hypothetical protein
MQPALLAANRTESPDLVQPQSTERSCLTALVLLSLSGAPGLGSDPTGLTRHFLSHEPPHMNSEHLTGPSV